MSAQTKTIKYRGFEITVKATITNYGICYHAENNYGEPYMEWVGHTTAKKAIDIEKANLDLFLEN